LYYEVTLVASFDDNGVALVELTDRTMISTIYKFFRGQGEFDKGSSGRFCVERLRFLNVKEGRMCWFGTIVHVGGSQQSRSGLMGYINFNV
jgi:hypothetical protein